MREKTPEALARRRERERLRQKKLREDPEYRKKGSLRRSKWNRENRERHRAHVERWNAENKERVSEYRKEWAITNRGRVAELKDRREPDVAIRRVGRELRDGKLKVDDAVKRIGEHFARFNEKQGRGGDGSDRSG